MTRLTIRLHAEEYVLVKKEAKALGISLAELVRRAIRDKLRLSNQAPWMRYTGMVASGGSKSTFLLTQSSIARGAESVCAGWVGLQQRQRVHIDHQRGSRPFLFPS